MGSQCPDNFEFFILYLIIHAEGNVTFVSDTKYIVKLTHFTKLFPKLQSSVSTKYYKLHGNQFQYQHIMIFDMLIMVTIYTITPNILS